MASSNHTRPSVGLGSSAQPAPAHFLWGQSAAQGWATVFQGQRGLSCPHVTTSSLVLTSWQLSAGEGVPWGGGGPVSRVTWTTAGDRSPACSGVTTRGPRPLQARGVGLLWPHIQCLSEAQGRAGPSTPGLGAQDGPALPTGAYDGRCTQGPSLVTLLSFCLTLTHLHICTHLHMHTFAHNTRYSMYTCTHTHLHAHTHTFARLHTTHKCLHVSTHICEHTCNPAHAVCTHLQYTSTHACTAHICMHSCTSTCTCARTCTRLHTPHTFAREYTSTHTHTPSQATLAHAVCTCLYIRVSRFRSSLHMHARLHTLAHTHICTHKHFCTRTHVHRVV